MKSSPHKAIYTLFILGFIIASSVVPIRSVSASAITTPLVLYTDIASGPTTGGENNNGIYLSIFGKNFGSSMPTVLIGGQPVARYIYFGASHGRPDIQQVSVQVGALGNPVQGTPLPIDVQVNGVNSNTNVTFTPNPGTIYFINNVTGNDSTGVPGDVTHPYLTVQTSNEYSGGVWPLVGPGDFIVMMNTGVPYVGSGFEGYFMRFFHGPGAGAVTGSAPTGAVGTGPTTLMGYPGATEPFINATYANDGSGGVAGINGYNYQTCGSAQNAPCSQWSTVVDLKIEGGGYDGPVDLEIYGNHWRVVNNELTAATATSAARSGGIAGNGTGVFLYGNYIHDIDSPDPGLENHGIYIDNDGSYDIGYNYIKDVRDGNGFQMYTYGFLSTTQYTQNVVFHHNWIQNVAKHGLNIADGTKSGIVIYDNLIMNSADAGMRFNTNTLQGAKVYNNTFYISNAAQYSSSYGMIMNEWNLPSNALDIENNIFIPTAIGTAPGAYSLYNLDSISGSGTIKNNLWYNGTGSYTSDTAPITGNPLFVNPGTDFHLTSGSAAIDTGSSAVSSVVTDDYDATTPRPQGTAYDIGMYEYASGGSTTPAPIITLSASPTSVTSGGSSTLTWSSTNATSCTASGGWTGTKATSG
ncbi:MAG: choice-of-anchor Q domain-containing protein, partial [Minisyncoccota bacterium]